MQFRRTAGGVARVPAHRVLVALTKRYYTVPEHNQVSIRYQVLVPTYNFFLNQLMRSLAEIQLFHVSPLSSCTEIYKTQSSSLIFHVC